MEIYENRNLKDLYGEIWKEISEYEDYQVSNFGRIKSFKGKDIRILKQNINKGYLQIKLYKNGEGKDEQIHRLLFKTFNNYKLKKDDCVHHLDKNPSNNVLENFKLMNNSKHNSLHMSGENNPLYGKTGENHPMYGKHHSEETKRLMRKSKIGKKCPEVSKRMSGENHPNVKLTELDIIRIKELLDEGILTQKEIGEIFGVHQTLISAIKNGRIWKHI